MTKHEVLLGGEAITSLVMSEEEFEGLMQDVAAGPPVVNPASGRRMRPEDVDAIRAEKHLRMVARGTLTEHLFVKYGVTTRLFSAIVRGQGVEVAKRHLLD